jgi:hypothetical protein
MKFILGTQASAHALVAEKRDLELRRAPISRDINITLNLLALAALVAAIMVLIYATVVWCLDVQAPWRLLAAGLGLGSIAAAFSPCAADRSILKRYGWPPLLAFVAEYCFTFGTLGVECISSPVGNLAMWLHQPAALLGSVIFPAGGRESIRRDIAVSAVAEWVFLLGLILLMRRCRKNRAQRKQAT